MMTVGRGSSSASSVLAEAIRDGTAPAALILQESDEIIVLGAIVADEIYQTVMPILLVDDVTYRDVASLTAAQITADGQIDPLINPRPTEQQRDPPARTGRLEQRHLIVVPAARMLTGDELGEVGQQISRREDPDASGWAMSPAIAASS